MDNKSTVQEICRRFDNDLERFSNLDIGQVSTIDATVSLELITKAAKRMRPKAVNLLDVGCGAGNYTLKMLSKLPNLNCTLVDLSLPMLGRAKQRVTAATTENVTIFQSDIRNAALEKNEYDIILAGAILHHLREDDDWLFTFTKLFNLLKTGGCLMISDLVVEETPALTSYIWEKYGEYLASIGGVDYRDRVLAYIEKEDSPRPLVYQLDLMQKVGFRKVEVLHKNLCFAAYGAIK